MGYKKLWIALGLVLTISFAVLGGVGFKVLSPRLLYLRKL